MTLRQNTIATSAPASVILIRLVVGGVFFSEGIQKFLYPAENGVGRFTKIGIPAHEIMAPFVGVVEIVCGSLILIGLLTRLAAIPLIIDMLVAILSTKIPILLGSGFGASVSAPFPITVSGGWPTKRARTSPCCSARSFC
jgi:putative oxidoreductase